MQQTVTSLRIVEDSTDPAGSGARDITNFGLLLSGPTVLTVQDCTVRFEQDHNQYEMRVDKDFDGTRLFSPGRLQTVQIVHRS